MNDEEYMAEALKEAEIAMSEVCNIRTMYDVYRGYYTKSYQSFSDWYECQ